MHVLVEFKVEKFTLKLFIRAVKTKKIIVVNDSENE